MAGKEHALVPDGKKQALRLTKEEQALYRLEGIIRYARGVAFAPTGKLLAFAGRYPANVTLWDVEANKEAPP